MAAIGHIEFSTFYRISLESCVISHFDQFKCTDSTGMVIFYNSWSSRGQSKMAAVGNLEILCFDIIALQSHVIPHY